MSEYHVTRPVPATAEREHHGERRGAWRPDQATTPAIGGCHPAYGAVEAARLALAAIGRRHGPLA